jgi:hypothetical protein
VYSGIAAALGRDSLGRLSRVRDSGPPLYHEKEVLLMTGADSQRPDPHGGFAWVGPLLKVGNLVLEILKVILR